MLASPEIMFSLKDKTALVTGAGGGIGAAIAQALAAAGANIVIAELDPAKLAASAARIRGDYGVKVLEFQLDVQDTDGVSGMFDGVKAGLGGLDILVNNAGIGIHKLPQDMSLAEWDLNVGVNLRGTFICCKAAYAHLKERGGGKIINLGSMYASFGAAAVSAYAASKGGVVQLTRSLAIAWAPDNIQVNAICPGFINTDLSASGKRDVPGMAEGVIKRTPAGRWGEPEDCCGAALFLASRAADFITGACLPVDGGYSVM